LDNCRNQSHLSSALQFQEESLNELRAEETHTSPVTFLCLRASFSFGSISILHQSMLKQPLSMVT